MVDIRRDLLDKWEAKRPQETPVVFTSLDGQQVAIKDESQNPTGTYKDWHGWMMGLDYLTNHFPQKFVYHLTSTGNAGMSDLYFADVLNEVLGEQLVRVVCFYPKHYDEKLLGPDSEGKWTDGRIFREAMEKYKSGAVIQVDFDERVWADNYETGETPCLDTMSELGLDVTRKNSMDITEGFKPTYRQVMGDFGRQIIDHYGHFPKTLAVIQFGAGMLYTDCKAVAQARGWPVDFLAVSTGNKDTIADKLFDSSEIWQQSTRDLLENGYTVARNSGDRIYHVTDQEILRGVAAIEYISRGTATKSLDSGLRLTTFGNLNKITAEPNGAAGIGIVPRVGKITGKNYDLIGVINTGNGIGRYAHSDLGF